MTASLPRPSDSGAPSAAQYLGIFFVAFSALAFEVALTRVLSYRFWYHYASLIIAIAMLGNGIAGTAAAFFRKDPATVRIWLFILAVCFSLSIPFGIVGSNMLDVSPQSFIVPLTPQAPDSTGGHQAAVSPPAPGGSLSGQVLLYLCFMVPFLFMGLIMTMAFGTWHRHINRLYMADLLGAGLGSVAVLVFVPLLGMERFIWMIGALGGLAAVCLSGPFRPAFRIAAALLPALLILPATGLVPHAMVFPTSKADMKNNPPFARYWDNIAQISLTSRSPAYVGIYMDWSCFTMIQKRSAGYEIRKHLYYNHYAPYLLRPNGVSCIIGAGGGRDVNAHLDAHDRQPGLPGPIHVYGVDLNPTMIRLLGCRDSRSLPSYSAYPRGGAAFVTNLLDFSGRLIADPRVTMVCDEGRNFIRSSDRTYDLIVQNNAYTFAAVQSGAFSVAENFLMTREAFGEYWDHLRPGGIFYFSRPFFEGARIVSVARSLFAERRMLAEFPYSIAVFLVPDPGYPVQQVFVKKGRFDRDEIRILEKFYAEHAAAYAKGRAEDPVVYAPFLTEAPGPAAPGRTLSWKEQMKHNNREFITELVYAGDDAAFDRVAGGSLTEIRPSTDKWPFFSQRAKLADFLRNESGALKVINGFFPQSVLVIKRSALIVSVLSLIFIILPLFFTRQAGLGGLGGPGFRGILGKIQYLVYFSAIGFGFMFIEIGLMQRFTLFLGVPIFAIVVVLTSMLAATGIGSYLSGFIRDRRRGVLLGLAGVVAIGILYLTVGDGVIRQTMGSVRGLRVLVTVLIVAPFGLSMGLMFPSAMGWVSENYPKAVSWGWALNGFASVLASLLANLTAIFAGLEALIWIAMAVYTAGTALFLLIRPRIELPVNA